MKLNFWPFHKHEYKIIRWRLVHYPEHEPSRRVIRFKCDTCKKETDFFPKKERDITWENKYRHLQGYWLGDEKILEREAE